MHSTSTNYTRPPLPPHTRTHARAHMNMLCIDIILQPLGVDCSDGIVTRTTLSRRAQRAAGGSVLGFSLRLTLSSRGQHSHRAVGRRTMSCPQGATAFHPNSQIPLASCKQLVLGRPIWEGRHQGKKSKKVWGCCSISNSD
jgi:hypothetical protein